MRAYLAGLLPQPSYQAPISLLLSAARRPFTHFLNIRSLIAGVIEGMQSASSSVQGRKGGGNHTERSGGTGEDAEWHGVHGGRAHGGRMHGWGT